MATETRLLEVDNLHVTFEHHLALQHVSFVLDKGDVMAVVGPNGSGKSIMLRAIALSVFLAHIGSFVPCGRAVIGDLSCC